MSNFGFSIFQPNRFYIVLGIALVSISFLGIRLFQKQIVQNNYYTALAQKQNTTDEKLPSNRGKIFISDDYNSQIYLPLATNTSLFSVWVIPKNIDDPDDAAEKLSTILNIDEKELYQKINNKKPYIPPIKKKVDKKTAKKIEDLNLKGVLLISESYRFYPEDTLASHITGFVNDDKKGQYGLEGYYDLQLKGRSGEFLGVKDTQGRYVSVAGLKKAEDGDDLYLTIDRNIQNYIETKLKVAVEKHQAKNGTIVIMDPYTGAILAMANYPDFNPNEYNKEKNSDIFTNKAISDYYEPGSVFKPFVMAGAVNDNKIDIDKAQTYGASINIGSFTISTSTGKSYGKETASQILENSDNVAMVQVGKSLGKSNLNKYLNLFGFKDRLGIDLAAETKPNVPEFSDWKETTDATISFGQGISVTPLQITTAMAAIANGGNLLQPYIVSKIKSSDGKTTKIKPQKIRKVIEKDIAKEIKKMLINVVEKGHGRTAKVSGFKVAGKTGTAQIPNPQGKGYLEDQNIGSFCGFAPATDPAFVMLVKLDSPQGLPWAESSAAPVFGEIAKWLLSYLQVPPG